MAGRVLLASRPFGQMPYAMSQGITMLLWVVGDLTSGNECQGGVQGSPWHPLLTVAYRPVGHGSGMRLITALRVRSPGGYCMLRQRVQWRS